MRFITHLLAGLLLAGFWGSRRLIHLLGGGVGEVAVATVEGSRRVWHQRNGGRGAWIPRANRARGPW